MLRCCRRIPKSGNEYVTTKDLDLSNVQINTLALFDTTTGKGTPLVVTAMAAIVANN